MGRIRRRLLLSEPRAVDIPLIAPVRQTAVEPAVTDVAAGVRRAWAASRLAERVKRGDRVAVGVGSRGIANYQLIARATLDALRELGARPFLVAAMGSHGGATAEGQRELLASYGITEEALGVPVKTDMDAKQIGVNSWGEPVWWDANALSADAVVLLNRVKPHTDFRGSVESGVAKMLVIGFGKRDGAAQHHRWGVRGLRDMLPETCKVILEKTKFVAGLAVLENAREETAHLDVIDRDDVLTREPTLLDKARGIMGRLPFDHADLLVIGEVGKNYSGAGIDPNVVGRLLLETTPEPEGVRITRICALDVSPESHGNATGIGIADLTTERAVAAIDPSPFRMNNLTACFLWRSKLPITFPTDRECIANGLLTCWQPLPDQLKVAVIPNTLEVADLWVSPALLADVRKRPGVEVLGEARPLPFDAAGNLRQEELFPHSVRGRRHKHTTAH
jgi:hypothetical protein